MGRAKIRGQCCTARSISQVVGRWVTMFRDEVQAELDPERRALFWRFLHERQRVWQRRFVQRCPPPWTEDPVLQSERFTNVYRELDPGTQYALMAILETTHAKEDKIFNILLYRLI